MTASSLILSRPKSLAIHVALLPLLAAMLFGLFSFILPWHQWTVWRVPILIATAGVVALLIVWPFRQPMRAGMLDGLATILGLASAVPGVAISVLIAFGLSLHVAENQYSVQSLIYQLTHPTMLKQILGFALVPVVPGVIGLWLARRRATTRTSLVAMAARFSTLGLSLSGLIV